VDWPNVAQRASSAIPIQTFLAAVTLTAGAGFQSLSSGLSRKASGMIVEIIMDGATGGRDFLTDIAVDGVIVAPDLLCSGAAVGVATFPLPIEIPASKAITAQTNSDDGGGNNKISVTPVYGGWDFPSCSRVISIGAGVRTAIGGTGITPGTSHSKGSYSALTTSLAKSIRGCCFALGSQSSSALSIRRYSLDVAVHTVPEVIIIPDVPCAMVDNEAHFPLVSPWLDIEIAAGTRISARMSCHDSSANPWDIVMYGGV
jgi:hypothetical protein